MTTDLDCRWELLGRAPGKATFYLQGDRSQGDQAQNTKNLGIPARQRADEQLSEASRAPKVADIDKDLTWHL